MSGPAVLVLVCTSCQHVTEIVDDGDRLPDQCPRCDGWAFTGDLVATTSTTSTDSTPLARAS
ncbi:zinc ribbon-containing protein [Pseudonocardia sp. ICBG1034]|uniref:zinc ribbon-containing protein n=1 Tax=Pseudonocardia sp. ICBG1034 TaxID=2844381 RepID=UPI001CCB47BE|nr:zinc ribbon-containing protein [Pseudonocardia sp. ICBG1034]